MVASISAFSIPTRIVFGEGAAAEAGRELAALGARKVLVVSDRGLARAGLVQPLCGVLEAAGLGHAAFLDVEANPSVETVEAGLVIFRAEGCDGLLAVGGGSPMDTAKAIGVLATNALGIRAYEGVGKVQNPIPPLIAVPTTVGTGSEVTFFAVVTDVQRQFKMPVVSPLLAPRVALLDPAMVAGLPASMVATTGMDALSHAVESFLSKLAQPFTDAQSLAAVELIGASFLPAVRGDRHARGQMLAASCLAGMGFTVARLGVCHALAHPLGAVFGVPHGAANAVLLPHSMAFNLTHAEARLARLAVALGVKTDALTQTQAASAAVERVAFLAREAGIPARLRDVGVTEDAIPHMAADAITSGNCAINPRPIVLEDLVALYNQAM